FTEFSEPRFSQVRPQSNTNSSFFVQPAVVPVIVGGDFASFVLPVQTKRTNLSFTNFTFVPPTQNYVFTPFSQPVIKPVTREGQINFEIGFLGPAQTPPWFVFSEYSQPKFKQYTQQPDIFFEIQLPEVIITTPTFSG